MLMQLAGLNFDLGGLWNTIGLIAKIVAGGLIVILVMLVMRYVFKFNKPVTLLMKAGEGWTIKTDRGSLNTKKRDFTLMKFKHLTVSVPESENIFLKGGKETYIGVVINSSVAWTTVGDNGKFVPADINMMNFLVDMYARIDEATKLKQGFWDKYGHQILWGITMMVFLVVIILILQRMDKIIGMASSVATQAAAAKQVV
jgi:hypothetical protein